MNIKVSKIYLSVIVLLVLASCLPVQKEKVALMEKMIPLEYVEISEYVGMGGSTRLRSPYNLIINSFREWDHYHEPGTGEPNTLPAHRFWTWGKMNRPEWTPAGKCMSGGWASPLSQEVLNGIFECDKPILNEILNKYPGAMHQVGNEPDYGPYITPANYARQFRLYEQYIHSIDPTAQMLNGGVTLGWRDWVVPFIQEYQRLYGKKPPIDVWVLHPYALGWSDGYKVALSSIKTVMEFRNMLDNNRYADTPILFGEFSDACGCNPEHELITYAITFCDWIVANKDTYNIIGWYWWGSSSVAMGNAGLFDINGNITPVGEAYITHCGLHGFKTYLPLIIK